MLPQYQTNLVEKKGQEKNTETNKHIETNGTNKCKKEINEQINAHVYCSTH